VLTPYGISGFESSPVWVLIWGEDPISTLRSARYLASMNLILALLVLCLLFGGGGFYFGGPYIGGGGIGLIVLICLVIFVMGGFRTKN